MALSLSFLLRSARPAAAPLRLAATALQLFCGDLSSPHGEKDGDGLNSVNAGIPFGETDVIARMRLMSASSFARDSGILAGSSLRTWIATCDWSRYYLSIVQSRQLPKPIRELFSQLQWLGPDGPQIDWSTILHHLNQRHHIPRNQFPKADPSYLFLSDMAQGQ